MSTANREKLAKRLETASPKVKDEIRYLVDDVERDEPEAGEKPYDEVDAFEELADRADFPEWSDYRKECRQILIDIGYYRVMPQKEIDSTYVTSGTKWAFKMGGVAYTMDYSVSGYFERDEE